MHETTSYEVVAGVVEDEVKDEEKQIDVKGVEVALPPPAPVDEPAATPFDDWNYEPFVPGGDGEVFIDLRNALPPSAQSASPQELDEIFYGKPWG